MENKIKTLLSTAIVSGLLIGANARAEETAAPAATGDQPAAEKNSCKAKNSCKHAKKKGAEQGKGKKEGHKKGDKNSCGENSCGSAESKQ